MSYIQGLQGNRIQKRNYSLLFCIVSSQNVLLKRQDTLQSYFQSVSVLFLKLQALTFTSLSPSMFENLELQFLAELSSFRGVVIRCSGTAPARMNLMFWGECVVVSHCTGVDIYYLCFGIYDPNQNFHRMLPSEQVTSLPRLFCPAEEKSITINHATNGD